MKQTRKAMRASVRKELAEAYRNKYEDRIRMMGDNFDKLHRRHKELVERYGELMEENDMLKVKLHQYEDWIERLREFCNMDIRERENYKEEMRRNMEEARAINEMLENCPYFILAR